MSLKKYFGLFNIRQQVMSSIESFNVDSKTLITNEEKKEAAKNLIDMVAKLNGAISLQPIPFADAFLLTPIQVSLVMKIAQIYNKDIDNKVVQEVVGTIVKGLLARTFAKSLVKYIPVIGAPAYFFISYVMTQSIGLAAIKAFETNKNFNIEEVKETFEKEYKKVTPPKATDPVNIVINNTVSLKPSNPEPLMQKAKRSDLKTVQEETRSTIIYLPSEN